MYPNSQSPLWELLSRVAVRYPRVYILRNPSSYRPLTVRITGRAPVCIDIVTSDLTDTGVDHGAMNSLKV